MLPRSNNITLFVTLIALVVALTSLVAHAQTADKRIILTPISSAPSYAKYALVIGVSDYPGGMRLHSSGNDARNFAALLKCRFGFDNVVLMIDDPNGDPGLRPTERNIQSALDSLYTGIVPDKSEVIFFYSGHGTRGKDGSGVDADWLVPEDFDRNHILSTCINFTAIRQRLDTLHPKRVLLITDACRDLLGKGIGSSGYGQTIGEGTLGPEVAELQSCLPTESSLEGDPADFKEGVFTHYLIKGLSGDPDATDTEKNAVTFDSLKQYVQYSVHLYAAKMNAVQTPDGRATLGAMVLARFAPTPAPTHPPVIADISTTAALTVSCDAPDASIIVDGQPGRVGIPVCVDLGMSQVKAVEVDVSAPGYRTGAKRVTLARGDSPTLSFTLDPLPHASNVSPRPSSPEITPDEEVPEGVMAAGTLAPDILANSPSVRDMATTGQMQAGSVDKISAYRGAKVVVTWPVARLFSNHSDVIKRLSLFALDYYSSDVVYFGLDQANIYKRNTPEFRWISDNNDSPLQLHLDARINPAGDGFHVWSQPDEIMRQYLGAIYVIDVDGVIAGHAWDYTSSSLDEGKLVVLINTALIKAGKLPVGK
ncbi:MAG: caspase family protein [Capsulimonadaceae bacterium]|nr:caspase family protein [Capsulimonadaceae bacterium]